jgi:hypothetical protein
MLSFAPTANHRHMPRRPCLLVAACGSESHDAEKNEAPSYIDAEDHLFHLTLLAEVTSVRDLGVHAHALKSHHLNLLVTRRGPQQSRLRNEAAQPSSCRMPTDMGVPPM